MSGFREGYFNLTKKPIHGFAATHILKIMELDFVEIRLLSPRGLWSLAPVRALIEVLLVVLQSWGGQHTPFYMHMLKRQRANLRDKIALNLNMRIKAWVLQCPDRIAWVRGIIGEVAINRWRNNRLADYALRRYFGDWQRKFSDGFKNGGFQNKEQTEKPIRKPSFGNSIRPYNWQPFALVKIVDVCGFLYGRPAQRKAPILDKFNTPNWTQPRGARARKPVRFSPKELEANAATGHEESGADEFEQLPVEDALSDAQVPLDTAYLLPYETEPP